MTFLPIIERELATRARQWPTYWVRVIVGFFGTLLCVQQLEVGQAFGSAAQAGRTTFGGLVVVGFIVCCFGCLATCDAISGERREKTLGLLFLTEVRAVDILLGKLASGTFVMLCALVAFLPVLMIPVLAGGVSGREATHIGLMLIDTLMLSLAIGLYASVQRVEWFKAAKASVYWVLLILFGPPMIQAIIFLPSNTLALLSPLWGIFTADDVDPAPFWTSLVLVQMMVWVFFIGTVRRLKFSLSDPEAEMENDRGPARMESATHYAELKRPLLRTGVQPIGWLLRRQKGIGAAIWLGTILSLMFYGLRTVMPVFGGFGGSGWSVGWPMAFAGTVVSGGLFAWAASHFFFESRRSGALELLITTPVGAKTIVWEQWLYLRSRFRWPLVVMLAVLLPSVAQFLSLFSSGNFFDGNSGLPMYALSLVFSVVNMVLGLVALGWAGMWFGLKARTQATAVFQTVAWVKALPYVVGYGWMLITRLVIGGFSPSSSVAYMFFSALPQLATVLFYLWLIRWLRARMLDEIRNADALPFTLRGSAASGWKSGANWFRRMRHWTPS